MHPIGLGKGELKGLVLPPINEQSILQAKVNRTWFARIKDMLGLSSLPKEAVFIAYHNQLVDSLHHIIQPIGQFNKELVRLDSLLDQKEVAIKEKVSLAGRVDELKLEEKLLNQKKVGWGRALLEWVERGIIGVRLYLLERAERQANLGLFHANSKPMHAKGEKNHVVELATKRLVEIRQKREQLEDEKDKKCTLSKAFADWRERQKVAGQIRDVTHQYDRSVRRVNDLAKDVNAVWHICYNQQEAIEQMLAPLEEDVAQDPMRAQSLFFNQLKAVRAHVDAFSANDVRRKLLHLKEIGRYDPSFEAKNGELQWKLKALQENYHYSQLFTEWKNIQKAPHKWHNPVLAQAMAKVALLSDEQAQGELTAVRKNYAGVELHPADRRALEAWKVEDDDLLARDSDDDDNLPEINLDSSDDEYDLPEINLDEDDDLSRSGDWDARSQEIEDDE